MRTDSPIRWGIIGGGDLAQKSVVPALARLADADYLMGERFTVADVYLFTVLGWMRFFSIGLDRWPSLPGYVRRVAERPSVSAALAREQEIAPVAE